MDGSPCRCRTWTMAEMFGGESWTLPAPAVDSHAVREARIASPSVFQPTMLHRGMANLGVPTIRRLRPPDR